MRFYLNLIQCAFKYNHFCFFSRTTGKNTLETTLNVVFLVFIRVKDLLLLKISIHSPELTLESHRKRIDRNTK